MPCSLLLLKSFLFMPVIQGLCFNCSCEMKTFLLMNKHCHFLNICMQNVFKAIMKCFARVLGSFFSPSPERQFFSTFSFMLSSPIERPFRVNLFKQYQCFSVMNNFLQKTITHNSTFRYFYFCAPRMQGLCSRISFFEKAEAIKTLINL